MPTIDEIKGAALLAWEGHLTSVEMMVIKDIDITDIPCEQMENLISIVTENVWISNTTHSNQLGRLLANVKCQELLLEKMRLSESETRALVTAMTDQLQTVGLGNVILDIEELTQYDGMGRCKKLRVCDYTGYENRLRYWAFLKGWTVTVEGERASLVLEGEWASRVMEKRRSEMVCMGSSQAKKRCTKRCTII